MVDINAAEREVARLREAMLKSKSDKLRRDYAKGIKRLAREICEARRLSSQIRE